MTTNSKRLSSLVADLEKALTRVERTDQVDSLQMKALWRKLSSVVNQHDTALVEYENLEQARHQAVNDVWNMIAQLTAHHQTLNTIAVELETQGVDFVPLAAVLRQYATVIRSFAQETARKIERS